jgi:hypothetical protein
MSETAFVSRYQRRVTFVQDVLQRNSALEETVARDLAVKVLDAIDHIPEQTR